MTPFHIVLLYVIGLPSIEGKPPDLSKRVVHAVNCGGYRHVGAYGITYQEDRNPVGVVSDYGARYTFPNVPVEDRKLYETERYHNGDLTYVFDIAKDGEYVIVLKFSEVYFQSVGQKVFHVHVNDLPVKRDLDIFRESGATGVAYDLYIDVSIKKKEITIGDLIGDIDRELHIRLIPVMDNPKINAIAVLTGTSATLPTPPPPVQQRNWDSTRRRSRKQVLDEDDDDYEDLEPHTPHVHNEQHDEASSGPSVASGPRTPDPFADKNDNVFVYLGVALVCLLPVVAFLMHM
nr:SJCHGC05854 protein [Haemonchus contortus]